MADSDHLTHTGDIVGTLRYLALAGVTAALALVLVLGNVLVSWKWWEAAVQERRAEAAARDEAGQRLLAEHQAEESRQRLVRLHVTSGTRLLEEGDLPGSLVWFAEALKLDRGDPRREEVHRVRLAAILRQCPKLVQVWPHDQAVDHAEFSPDGRRVVTVSGNTARVWDTATGEPALPPLQTGSLLTLAEFSPDGRYLLTATCHEFRSGEEWHRAGRARVWDAATGRPVGPVLQQDGPVLDAAFHPDGRRLVLVSQSKAGESQVQMCDVTNGQRRSLAVKTGGNDWVVLALFSPDGRRLLLLHSYRTAELFDVATSQPATPPLIHEDPTLAVLSPSQAAFSPDGRLLATSTWDRHGSGVARLWEVATGRPVGPPMRSKEQTVVSFSPDGRLLVAAGGHPFRAEHPGQAVVWETATGRQVYSVGHAGPVSQAVFSPDGGRLLTASADGTARLWDALTGQPVTAPLRHGGEVRQARFSPNGRQVLTAGADGLARVWDLVTEETVAPPLICGEWKDNLRLNPDGRRLVTAGTDGLMRVRDAATGELVLPPWKYGNSAVRQLALSPDGRRAVLTCRDRTTRVWDVTTGRPVTPPLGHERMQSAGFSPDSRRLLTSIAEYDKEGEARVWDADTGRPVTPPLKTGPGDEFHDAFSADGRRLVTARGDRSRNRGEARVWAAATGELLFTLKHDRPVLYAEFSADGRRLVTAAGDRYSGRSGGEARVWDAATGQLVTTLKYEAAVLHAAFSPPDGSRVVTASLGRTARVWDATTGRPLTPPLRHSKSISYAWFNRDGRRVITYGFGLGARVWDAGTGDPITPTLEHSFASLKLVQFEPHDRFGRTISFHQGDPVWQLAPDRRPVEDWEQLAQVLAGRRLDPTGALTVLDSPDLARAWRALRLKYPGEGARSPEQVLAWHRREGAVHAIAKRWPQALWHLDRLIEGGSPRRLDGIVRGKVHAQLGNWDRAVADYSRAIDPVPDDQFARSARGVAHAQLGRWEQASADFARATEGFRAAHGGLTSVDAWYQHALLRLHLGDAAGYRRACAGSLQRYDQEGDDRLATYVAWTCVLGADAVTDPLRTVQLAKEVGSRFGPQPRGDPLGAAHYRAGQPDKAVERYNEVVKADGKGGTTWDWLFLALAHQKLGHAEEAKKWLARAVQAIGEAKSLEWNERLELQLLRREAEALIQGPPADGAKK